MLLSSYHPISLINVDVKILLQIIGHRLSVVMPHLIHPAQQAFINCRAAITNLRKASTALEQARLHPLQDLAIIVLDVEKAFDNVNLNWLVTILQHLSFQDNILSFVTAMYESPTTRIHTSGSLPQSIPLKRGMRQGCPLSPLLFNMALKPLSRYLCNTSQLSGIPIGEEELSLALFADNILLFTSSPATDLTSLQEIFEKKYILRAFY